MMGRFLRISLGTMLILLGIGTGAPGPEGWLFLALGAPLLSRDPASTM